MRRAFLNNEFSLVFSTTITFPTSTFEHKVGNYRYQMKNLFGRDLTPSEVALLVALRMTGRI